MITADENPNTSAASSVRVRATLLQVWRVTPDAFLRTSIERELYGTPDPERAAEEWQRFHDFDARSAADGDDATEADG